MPVLGRRGAKRRGGRARRGAARPPARLGPAHLVSDVPVGVLLSGGIDSSVLAALAAEEVSERFAPSRSASRSGASTSSPTPGSLQSATDRPPRARAPTRCRPAPPALAEAFDEPFADSSALPTYLVSQLAADNVKVALSGEGGDELFGGYYTYAADLLAERAGVDRAAAQAVRRAPAVIEREGEPGLQGEALRPAAHLPALERHHGWKEIFSPDARAEADRTAGTSTRSTCFAHGSRRPRARSCSRGSRTSTSARTWSTTCS